MSQDNDLVDDSNVMMIDHICIRDPDTGEIILRQREKESNKNDQED
jgi:hypothetical protein